MRYLAEMTELDFSATSAPMTSGLQLLPLPNKNPLFGGYQWQFLEPTPPTWFRCEWRATLWLWAR
jgi:hypothetical protein